MSATNIKAADNKPTNIKDYVVKYIIEYSKNRDEELKDLRKELAMLQEIASEHCDIVKCDNCFKYRNDWGTCDICDVSTCKDCNDDSNNDRGITHVKTWNLSGSWMCSKCVAGYCHFCVSIGYVGCMKCREVFCERCTGISRTCKHLCE